MRPAEFVSSVERLNDRAAPPFALAAAFMFSLLALSVLDRFGLQLSAAFSIAPGLFAVYALVGGLLWTGRAVLNPVGALLYVGMVTLTGVSLFVNVTYAPWRQLVSLNSWLLLVVLYAPFVLQAKPTQESRRTWHWLMDVYLVFAAVLAVSGIVQYVAQYVVRGVPWLIDFTPLIPERLRGSGLYNTSNVMGSAFKSNGFFLREASIFSYHMALGLVLEWSLRRRIWMLLLLGGGLIVSYSGSGIMMLIAAMLVPLGFKTLLRVAAGVVALIVLYIVAGDALNLSYTLGRVGEFGSDRSSAYCRFIAPVQTVVERIDSAPWVSVLGQGPGTMQKLTTVCETTYGKVVFEYGLMGGVLFGCFLLQAVLRPWLPLRMRVVLVVSWLALGGNLLAPDVLLALFLFCAVWPSDTGEADEQGGRKAQPLPDTGAGLQQGRTHG